MDWRDISFKYPSTWDDPMDRVVLFFLASARTHASAHLRPRRIYDRRQLRIDFAAQNMYLG